MQTARNAVAQGAVTSSSRPVRGEERPPWPQWVLAVITLGIYAAAHHYRINRELRDYGVDVDPARALLAFFPGGLVVVPYLITVYRTGERIRVAQETAGLRPTISPELAAVAAIFAVLNTPYEQAELNKAWKADAEGELS